MRTGLLSIDTFAIPCDVLTETIRFLRRVGAEGYEGFVLWSGRQEEDRRFAIRSAMIPKQRASKTDNGLLVTVDGAALFDINRTAHERGEILAAQVHSHPTDAYHSSTDDAYPLVTIVGGMSIVIPDFARHAPRDIERWAWFRLSNASTWEPAEATTQIELV
ncbi:MAG: MPN domain-containing protein [Gemmatimonadaceae bacterium]